MIPNANRSYVLRNYARMTENTHNRDFKTHVKVLMHAKGRRNDYQAEISNRSKRKKKEFSKGGEIFLHLPLPKTKKIEDNRTKRKTSYRRITAISNETTISPLAL